MGDYYRGQTIRNLIAQIHHLTSQQATEGRDKEGKYRIRSTK